MSAAQVTHFSVLGWTRVRRSRSSSCFSEVALVWGVTCWASSAEWRSSFSLTGRVGMKCGVWGEEDGVVEADEVGE